jgi:uncharacterized membrane protein
MATLQNDVTRNRRTEQERSLREGAGSSAGVFSGMRKNVGGTERLLSALGGGALALYGLKRGGMGGAAMAVAGGSLLFRGATGHCELYKALGINRTERGEQASLGPGEGVRVEKSVIVDRPREEVYAFWRNLENLPRFMNHLESVTVIDGKISHWVAKGPAGTTVEWDAEIISEEKNELIGWRSLEGEVDNAGSVHFADAPGGKGTEIRVILRYNPPAGKLGAAVANLWGEDADTQVEDDLRRLKQVLETGSSATTGGQPSGRAL